MAQCCPVNTVYIDSGGFFDDIGFGTGSVSNFVPSMGEKCTRLTFTANGSWLASSLLLDPEDCPCCPTGLEWSSYKHICMNSSGQTSEPIPCIICVCPPPDPFVCEDCGSDAEHIDFPFDFHSRQCETCKPEEENNPPGHIQCFIPGSYLSPTTLNFKLRNKNFI